MSLKPSLDDVEGLVAGEVDRFLFPAHDREGKTGSGEANALLELARARAPVDVRITWTS